MTIKELIGRSATKAPLITVRSGLYAAVIGALGDILTVLAIPVGPNVHINLYILPAILVGSTNGWFLGALAMFIGSLYTPILWGWFGAIVYATQLGAIAGFLSTRVGFRPLITGVLTTLIGFPLLAVMEYIWLGMPWPVIWFTLFTTVLQMVVASVIVEVLLAIPALKKRFPRGEIRAVGWVARSKILRHPWLEDA